MIKVRFKPTPSLGLVFNFVTTCLEKGGIFSVIFFFSDDNYDMGNNE